jgi:hypothetical protein
MNAPFGRYIVVGVITAVVVAAVIAGIAVLGPPSEERARRLDLRRSNDLRQIAFAARAY